MWAVKMAQAGVPAVRLVKKLQCKQKGRYRSLDEGLQNLPGRADMLSWGYLPG